MKLGSLLAGMGRKASLTEDGFAVFEQVRDKSLALSLDFEQ